MASTYLQRTPSSASNRKTWTWSGWVKRSSLSDSNQVLFEGIDGSGFPEKLQFTASDILEYDHDIAGTDYTVFVTDRSFRDTSAWYHIVFAKDTTQSTEADRIKIYVNGEQQSLSEYQLGYPPQNYDGAINNTVAHYIGANNGEYFNGSMSHINFCDGTAYDASAFGETDATTGEWKIKTSPSVTYGTNGFFILKDGNSVTDQSGNGNNFTVAGGTLTNTEDCPSNVFCTWNPLNKYWAGGTYSWGNNKIVLPNNDGAWNTGTLAMTSGKYYWEVKVGGDYDGVEVQLGIADKSPIGNASSTAGKAFGYSSNGEYGIYVYNGAFIGNAVANPYTSYGFGASDGYIMIAVDLDNNKFYGGANGTWFDSGDPSNGINGKTIQAVADTVDGCYYPAVSTYQGYTGTIETNFGNGYFADNAVSSAGTNASGNGIFKYDVPTGYTALSTKGLNL